MAPITKVDEDVKTHSSSMRNPYREDEMKTNTCKTAIDVLPVTVQRPPYVRAHSDPIIEAGVPRVNIAPSKEKPFGTTENEYAAKRKNQSVLQQHCAYWDPDGDGIIGPLDTYRGCREWGWNLILCLLATVIIHAGLSYLTVPGLLPDPFFRLWINRMHKNKHGSDSQTYDNEGRFRPQQFEDIFAKYDRGNKGGLSKGDVWYFLKGQRLAIDPWGASATALEWIALYLLLWPKDGIMRKEDVRGAFDGSLFYRKAEKNAQRSKSKPRRLKSFSEHRHQKISTE